MRNISYYFKAGIFRVGEKRERWRLWESKPKKDIALRSLTGWGKLLKITKH